MKFTLQVPLYPSGHGYSCYFLVPDEAAEQMKTAFGSRRTICHLPNGHYFHCALMPRKAGGHTINVSKALLDKGQLEPHETYTLVFEKDESEYQMEVPEEWMEVLGIDPEAKEIFDGLTKGKQRSIMHLVGSAKQIDTRINRALKIAENLKLGARTPKEFLR